MKDASARRNVELLILPTSEAIEMLIKAPADISVELLLLVNRLKPHTNDVGLLGTRPRKILASSRDYELIMISTRFKAGL